MEVLSTKAMHVEKVIYVFCSFFSLQIEKPTELSRRERSVGFFIILFLIVGIHMT